MKLILTQQNVKSSRVLLCSLFLALFLVPHASFATGKEAGNIKRSDCLNLMNSFLNRAIKVEHLGQITAPLSQKEKYRLVKTAIQYDYDDEMIQQLILGLNKSTDLSDSQKMSSYILYVQSLRNHKKEEALLAIGDINSNLSDNTFVKNFNKYQQKIDNFESKEYKKQLQKIKKDHPNLSSTDQHELAKTKAHETRFRYEKIVYGCMSKKWTPERRKAADSYGKFVVGIGMTSNASAYTYQHSHEDMNGEWFGRLGYELGMGFLFSKITSKVISNPSDSNLQKAVKKYLFGRGLGFIDSRLYAYLLGSSEQEAEQELNKILQNPNNKEDLEKLKDALGNEYIVQKFEDLFSKHLKQFLPAEKKDGPLLTGDQINWKNLDQSDLDNPEVKDLLIAATLASLYEERKGGYIQTGDQGYDRYAFYSVWSAAFMPKDLAVDLVIYHLLCHGSLNPKMAVVKALSVYTLNKVIFDQLHYYIREQAINQ